MKASTFHISVGDEVNEAIFSVWSFYPNFSITSEIFFFLHHRQTTLLLEATDLLTSLENISHSQFSCFSPYLVHRCWNIPREIYFWKLFTWFFLSLSMLSVWQHVLMEAGTAAAATLQLQPRSGSFPTSIISERCNDNNEQMVSSQPTSRFVYLPQR